MNLKKNDITELDITDISDDALGIGHVDGFALFVKNALPGDYVRCVVTKINKGYGFAKALEILKPSESRVAPACMYAGKCGGCQLMELDYKKQLELKSQKVWNDLSRLGGTDLSCIEKEEITGMETGPCPLNYRNKVQFPAGRDSSGKIITGFYAQRTHYIIKIQSCPAAFKEADIILEKIRAFAQKNNISVYDEKTGKGLLRHVLVRRGSATSQIMVCLIINGESLNPKTGTGKEKAPDIDREFVSALKETGLNIVSICLNVNKKNTNVILGQKTLLLYGRDYIEEKISGLTFKISAHSFFQVNTLQAEKLYAKALEYACLRGEETVWDLYCGTGTISLFLALKAKKVYGVEIIPQAIENAKENACLNNIKNAVFICGKAEEIFPRYYASREHAGEHAGVVVLDPPRRGCERILLEAILKASPERIVYISCNSATLSRDIKILSDKYILKKAAAFDMFPHTIHCEVCVSLVRRKDIS